MLAAMSVAALVLGAGRGARLGCELPKAFVSVSGMTLLERSIRVLAASDEFVAIQPVLAKRDFDRFKELRLQDLPTLREPVEGGAERQDSVRAGLDSLPDDCAWVAVHDSARCLVSAKDVRRVVAAGISEGAAILAEPVRDTIKRVVDGRIQGTPRREECWAAQTPQVMRCDWLREAMAAAASESRVGTDDAQLIEWLGRPVVIVESEFPNPKVTRPEDLVLAEALLSQAKTE
ncbi:MAG TPA: 2-C-methyl-D-erythritol 4-phosphate cytidylyltransferase [Myxococcales bacterium]|jgi:2-C-methyl-D-erythritol 4-phosphate cytidylyltransferase|nr:2-C-methyl-D-erythritol 4-phosphate cytidylyltransferase [Myxococcales bacterium]